MWEVARRWLAFICALFCDQLQCAQTLHDGAHGKSGNQALRRVKEFAEYDGNQRSLCLQDHQRRPQRRRDHEELLTGELKNLDRKHMRCIEDNRAILKT